MVPLLSAFRGQLASEPRDKVYSILGLLQPINEEGSTEVAGQPIHPQEFDPQSLPIDYTAPVEEVYARAVKSVVITTARLE
jgi:hypothetical protein